MYEARQNKEKVSRTINVGGGIRRREKLDKTPFLIKPSMVKDSKVNQMAFSNNHPHHQQDILNNYTEASNRWNNCLNEVNRFVGRYAVDGNFTNPHMENNMLAKSEKAATTLVGESFEPYRWQQGNGIYYGPGSGWIGTDIKMFTNSPLSTGRNSEEVKSSDSIFWRLLFQNVPNGVIRIAFLSGAALTDAQNSMQQGLIQNRRQYIFYDKNNPNAPVGITN